MTELPTHGPFPIRLPYGREWLPTLFRELGYVRGCEIGTWKAEFAERLCQGIPGLELLCVDPYSRHWQRQRSPQKRVDWEATYQMAVARLAPYAAIIKRRRSVEAAPEVEDGSLDFCFIDGDHTEASVRTDIEKWAMKVRRGGIIAGHDFCAQRGRRHQEVKRAVMAYTKAHAIAPWFVLAGDVKPSFMWIKA